VGKVTNNRVQQRLQKHQKDPVSKVGRPEVRLDWLHPQRAKIADQMTRLVPLGASESCESVFYHQRDTPIARAFEYFKLDHSDPRQWRVLLTELAAILFPNPRRGPRLETVQRNVQLLERSLESGQSKDIEIIKYLKKKHKTIYGRESAKNLRKRLKAARQQKEVYLHLFEPLKPASTIGHPRATQEVPDVPPDRSDIRWMFQNDMEFEAWCKKTGYKRDVDKARSTPLIARRPGAPDKLSAARAEKINPSSRSPRNKNR
jgi:hypothetical protein